jgi:tRNA-specific 2-thiouridylase
LGLAVADKPDSQDICFVPEGRYAGVILKMRPDAAEPGNIVHVDGRMLGQHDGIIHFTVGQRRGLGIGGGEPLYVVKLEADTRQVVVGPREALLQHEIELSSLNWLGREPLTERPLPIHAKIRSAREAVPGSVRFDGGRVMVGITGGEYGVSPGQACVLYDGAGAGAQMLGGGTIARKRPHAIIAKRGNGQVDSAYPTMESTRGVP